MKVTPPLVLVCLVAFLAPIIGGGTLIDPQPIGPGEFLGSMMGKGTGTMLSTALLTLLLAISAVIVARTNKVIVMPQPKINITLLVLAVFIFFSVLPSTHRFVSLQVSLPFLTMIGSVYLGVAILGREAGPRLLFASIVGGCVAIAGNGIIEYGLEPDPNWRIFSTWFNPNVLAGMLIFGVILSFGLAVTTTRVASLASAIGGVICTIALLLSGSKGGLLALAVGAFVFLVLNAFSKGEAYKKALLIPLIVLLLGFGLTTAINARSKQSQNAPVGGASLGRLSQSGEAEQSVGFRKLLWESAFSLMKENPLGTGIGTFRYYSAKPGLSTQTHHAHSTFLQLGAEAGVAALISLVALLILVLIESLKGLAAQPESIRRLKSAGIATLFAASVHNAIDSDWSHFGAGITFFLVLAAVLTLSVDGLTPENTSSKLRLSVAGLGVVVTLLSFGFASNDVRLGSIEYAVRTGQSNAPQLIDSQVSAAPWDSRSLSLKAQLVGATGGSPKEQVSLLQKAIFMGPTMSLYRSLARAYLAQGNSNGARQAFKDALTWDPNNLLTLKQWLDLETKEDQAQALEIAKRLVAVEDTSYFKIRSLPDVIPTETYSARFYIAKQTTDPKEQMEMLRKGIEGFVRYAKVTVPKIKQFEPFGYAGESARIAVPRLETALSEIESYESLSGADLSFANEAKEVLRQGLGLLSDSK